MAIGGCQDVGRFPSRSQKLEGHVDAAHIDEASHPELKLLEAFTICTKRPVVYASGQVTIVGGCEDPRDLKPATGIVRRVLS